MLKAALEALPDGHPDAFTFGMVISHENQHGETMLQALSLRSGAPLLDRGTALPAGRDGIAGTSVLVPAGEFVLGVDAATEPYSLDNERPAHVVDVPAFRIGRVCTTVTERGRGHTARLMRAALDEVGESPCRISAQTYLADMYARHGFAVAGAEFDEDGIPHVPMLRDAHR